MERKIEQLTVKDWCTRFGIKVVKPSGFRGAKNKVLSRLYTSKQFKRGIKASYITAKTEKGLAFLEALR